MGTEVFNYTESNINFIFSGTGVSHCTGVPYNVPDVPKILKGKKAYSTVIKEDLVVKYFLKKSVISWAGFGATNVRGQIKGRKPIRKKIYVKKTPKSKKQLN